MENKAPDLQLRADDILYIPNSIGKAVGVRGLETAIAVGSGIAIWH
jgi:polysaccharide export outer membrane protein